MGTVRGDLRLSRGPPHLWRSETLRSDAGRVIVRPTSPRLPANLVERASDKPESRLMRSARLVLALVITLMLVDSWAEPSEAEATKPASHSTAGLSPSLPDIDRSKAQD